MRGFKISCGVFLAIPTRVFFFSPAFAETYAEAVTHAQNNIDNNTNFIPSAGIILIRPGSTDYGLTYESYGETSYLYTRTFTKSKNIFNSSTQTLTGVGDAQIFGSPTTDAAWVTAGNDTTRFLDAQGATAATVTDLLERGLGMNNDGSHNTIVEYAVLPDNDHIMRPTRKPDIANYSTTSGDYAFSDNFDSVTAPSGMSSGTLTNLKAYLAGWQKDALGTLDSSGNPTWHNLRPQTGHENWGRFPWSELGYTYFWDSGGADLSHIQGMTEFIILGGTSVKIVGIYSPQSYLYTKNKGGVFSSGADAQYGNGFPNFNITGSCDTVWAGNAFQRNVSSTSSAPNTITISNAGSVSGGQGILVWSLNYLVTNNGVISGSTLNKLYYNSYNTGMTGTANIAVLFKGVSDVSGAVNQLVNSGTISSPGIAIEADSGDTHITNSGNGIISGNNYAILTAAGNDHVDINGGQITGSIDLGAGADQLDITGSDSNVTMNFSLDRDTRASSQVVNAEVVDIADNKLTLAVDQATGSKNIRDNDSFLIMDAATSLSADPAKIAVTNDPDLPMITFSASKSGNQLSLLAARDNSYYADHAPNSSLGAALDSLANTGSDNMAVIIGALDGTGNANNSLQLQPSVSLPVVNTQISALNNFSNMFSLQMARLVSDNDPEVEVYALNDGKKKKLSVRSLDNMLAYNSNSILENSFYRSQEWEVFATGFGTMTFQSDKGASVGYESAGGGTQIGFYRRVNDNLMLGFLGGYMFDSVNLNDKSASQDINSVRLGPCARLLNGNFYAAGAFTYGYHAVSGDRKITFGGLNLQADSDYSMNDLSPYVETGYIFHLVNNLEITPNVSLQYDWMRSSSYNESGAGAADLSVKAFDSNSLISVMGLRFNGRIKMKNMDFLPEFDIGWQHEYLGRADGVQASFSGESAGTFTTNTNMFDRSAVKLGAAGNFIYGRNRNVISLQYNAEIYNSASNHVFSITARNYF
ncbi:MAG: autotransporter domain-containing protein [Candidatus Omnitrophica bacterium]|nr:autotransporter domain-containing protein [Candidatus Omnitrophota bacterium]